jgi:hypothetical protein
MWDSTPNVLIELYQLLVQFLQRWGWGLVALAILWYNVRNTVHARLAAWRNTRSLAQANRPDRRSVLDRQCEEIRNKQQQQLLEARCVL